MTSMPKTKVKVRKWARFLPGIVWALLVDLLSIVLIAMGLLLIIVGNAVGVSVTPVLDAAISLLLLLMVFAIFEEPKMLIGGLEVIYGAIPLVGSILSIIPSYTLVYILIEWGYL